MNNTRHFNYLDKISQQNEKLDLDKISSIEEKCRQQRSEAILQLFKSVAASLRGLPETITNLVETKSSKNRGDKIASPSLSYGRPNLYTE